jgi:putative membrane protein
MLENTFKKAAIPVALISLGIAVTAVGQGTTSAPKAADTSASKPAGASKLAASDRTFVEKAAQGGMAEVELGKMAQQRAADAQVKQFGERMVTDHSKANDELKSIATAKGVNLPTSPGKEHEQASQKLQRLQGPAFDREYMKHMVTDHKKDVAEFQKEAKSGKDNDVKQFASKTLPTLEDHLKMAQQVEQATKSAKGASGK